MRRLSYIWYNCVYRHFLKFRLRNDLNTRFDGFRLTVLKGVFHPKFFFSTPFLYDFLRQKNLQAKRFLEIGSGSGVLSLLAFRKGALVTAIDIDPTAVKNTQINFERNFGNTSSTCILQSDLFSRLPAQLFDVIVINPPYFFKSPLTAGQHAWYCGPNGEYFQSLFAGLKNYMAPSSECYMILAENCEIERIREIATRTEIAMNLIEEKRIRWELNFIFRLN